MLAVGSHAHRYLDVDPVQARVMTFVVALPPFYSLPSSLPPSLLSFSFFSSLPSPLLTLPSGTEPPRRTSTTTKLNKAYCQWDYGIYSSPTGPWRLTSSSANQISLFGQLAHYSGSYLLPHLCGASHSPHEQYRNNLEHLEIFAKFCSNHPCLQLSILYKEDLPRDLNYYYYYLPSPISLSVLSYRAPTADVR